MGRIKPEEHAKQLTVGEVARRSGVAVSTLHFCDDIISSFTFLKSCKPVVADPFQGVSKICVPDGVSGFPFLADQKLGGD